jgi:hypothetical protein
MYTVRIIDQVGEPTDAEYETVDQAFGAVYLDELPLTETSVPTTMNRFAIYKDGICFHHSGAMAEIGDPL